MKPAPQPESGLGDRFDRQLRNEQTITKPHVLRDLGWAGDVPVYIIQTGRTDNAETTYLQTEIGGRLLKIVVPAAVLAVMDRQRELLAKQQRSRQAKHAAAARKASKAGAVKP